MRSIYTTLSISSSSSPSPSTCPPTQQLTFILLFLLLSLLPTTSHATTLQTTVIVTVTPTIPQPPSYTSAQVFEDTVLAVSNAYRAAHNASNLVWNNTLTAYARDWAETCKWEHSHGPYGENLAYGYVNASAAVQAWGEEYLKYNFEEPTGFSEETGHFTQLVWRATRQVGCAAVDCGFHGSSAKDEDEDHDGGGGSVPMAQGWYVVCEYVPAGNVMGGNKELGDKAYFKMNVQASSTYSGPYNTATTATTAPTQTASSGVAVGLSTSAGRVGYYWGGLAVYIVGGVLV